MTAYVKKGGKNFGSTSSRPSFGGDRGARKPFVKKSWGDNRSSDRPVTLHKATCSSCNATCDVPFRPVSGKPVFCKNCFVRTGDTESAGRAGDRFPRKEFSSRSALATPATGLNADIMKQLEMMNSKLERLIAAVESSSAADTDEQ